MMPRLAVLVWVVLLAVMTGCMKVGPDYQRPELPFAVPNLYQHDQSGQPYGVDDRWWEEFNDPRLNDWVEAVIVNNLDLQEAAARMLELRADVLVARAQRFPLLEGEARGRREGRGIDSTSRGVATDRVTTYIYNAALPASFEVDLWGRLARTEEARRAELLEAEEDRRTLAQSLVAEAVSLYLAMESFERRLQIAAASIETFNLSLSVVERRYRRGLTPILDVYQARRVLAQAEATVPDFRRNLGSAQQQLAVLAGRYPETEPNRTQPEDYFELLVPVPEGLPSELLLRRPDIKAAEAQLQSLSALVGEAKAARFPSVRLTGTYGYISSELDDLIRRQNLLWDIALGVVQPLFDAGELKAEQRAAEARFQQGVVAYARTVLNAFLEVERALLSRQEFLERRERFYRFLLEARATQRVAQNRYLRGLVNYLDVLDAQQTRFTAEENLVQVELDILQNRVALYRALGGGWGQPPPVAATVQHLDEMFPWLPAKEQ